MISPLRSLPAFLPVCMAVAAGVNVAAAADAPKPAAVAPLVAAEPAARDALRVLFLGDNGHHRPAYRAAQLQLALFGRGIAIDYTETLADLNAAKLAKYQALLVYANHTALAAEQEAALLDFVAGGGGFVPVHCASACFGNSDKFIALVGARFARHGTGTFDVEVADAAHPITRGLKPFTTWDETYVHDRHNAADRVVLHTRNEAGRPEPWTWVRTHGKGRVFYTAYGHDAHTWGQPGFHALLERGIRWAAGRPVFDGNPKPAADAKPFEYADAELPYYPAGKKWGVNERTKRPMQQPLSPAESMKHLVVPPGFSVKLVAADPQIKKPICMAWDHRGRLWIAETIDYPNELKAEGEGRDRIVICEDADGDGVMDKFTVFADKLSIPTGMCFSKGGLILLAGGSTLFLADTDGDDKADVRKVLFSGWNMGDTHAGPSNLVYGPDNWIYGISGYSGFTGVVGGEQVSFRTGFFRFKPDGSKLEFLRNTNNNSWGVGFSEEGLLFGSTANGNPSVYLPIPNRYYERVRGWSSSVLGNTAENARIYPITEKVRQVDWHGQFTAGAGHALYTARAYPKEYWNRTAFVTEPTGHLAATFLLVPKGSDFVSFNTSNLLASGDEWTSPIMAEVGPDGCVWVIDWYNYIVQHNPTPAGFKTGKGNAYETPLRDKRHGRIYRVVPPNFKAEPAPKLDPADPAGLVAALKNTNLFWRRHAQRLLVERGKVDVVPALIELVKDQSVDEVGLNVGAMHALWTIRGLAYGDDDLPDGAWAPTVAALKHPSAGVRRAAVTTLPRTQDTVGAFINTNPLKDPDPQVRLAAFLVLSETRCPWIPFGVLSAMTLPGNHSDRWIPDAAVCAAAAEAKSFLHAITQPREPIPAPMLPLIRRVAVHYARGAPVDEVGYILSVQRTASAAVAEAVIEGISDGWPTGKPAKWTEETQKGLAELFASLPAGSRGRLVALARKLGSDALDKHSAEIAAGFLKSARDENAPVPERVEAARRFVELRRNDAKAVAVLLEDISPRSPPELSAGLVSAVALADAPEIGAAFVKHLPGLTPAARTSALTALLSRGQWTRSYLDAVEAGKLRLDELSLDQKRGLAEHPDKAVAERAKALLAKGGGLPDADRQKVIDQLAPLVLKGGDAARGKAVFKQHCANCHRHNGEGNLIGPDLTGMAAHPKEELLIHVLDPSRSVEGNFRQYVVKTDDGRIIAGLMASETRTAVELIDSQAKKHVVLRENIDQLVVSTKSMMPEGFEKQATAEQLADLLEYLTRHGKYLPLDLRKAANVVTTKGMFYNEDAKAERLVFADWSPKTFAGVPFHLIDPQGEKAANAIMLHGPQGKFPPTMPKSVNLACRAPVKAIHLLSGVSGWGFPLGKKGSTTMTVRLHYADGRTEDHALLNGEHFADYIRRVDVPGSQHAFDLAGRQMRYLAIRPARTAPLDRIELIKGDDATAPMVMAITAETPE